MTLWFKDDGWESALVEIRANDYSPTSCPVTEVTS